jgi:hypothetical protein
LIKNLELVHLMGNVVSTCNADILCPKATDLVCPTIAATTCPICASCPTTIAPASCEPCPTTITFTQASPQPPIEPSTFLSQTLATLPATTILSSTLSSTMGSTSSFSSTTTKYPLPYMYGIFKNRITLNPSTPRAVVKALEHIQNSIEQVASKIINIRVKNEEMLRTLDKINGNWPKLPKIASDWPEK